MPRIEPISVALGVGASGALVDVSQYVKLDSGVERRWGRDDQFYATDPGSFSFVLENQDGRFTPENASSPLSTTLSEGASACILIGTRLTNGTVRTIEPEFPGNDAAWASVRVSCDDLLGELSRVRLTSPTQSASSQAGGVWPFSDPEGSVAFADITGRAQPISIDPSLGIEYEVSATAPGGGDQVTWFMPSATAVTFQGVPVPGSVLGVDYEPGYAAGVWVTPRNLTSYLKFEVNLGPSAFDNAVIAFGVSNDTFFVIDPTGPTTFTSAAFTPDRAYHLSVDLADDMTTVTFRIDGVEIRSFTVSLVAFLYLKVTITVGSVSAGETEVSVADLTITPSRVEAENIIGGTVPTRLGLYSAMSNAGWDALPATLYPAVLTSAETDGKSLLDVVNEVLTIEQGYLFTETTGTLTNPVGVIKVRERARPESVDYTFNIVDEAQTAPNFVRDITNLISRVRVNSPAGITVVLDEALTARAGNASESMSLPIAIDGDRLVWGQDRILRGSNTRLRIPSLIVDAMTTPSDRSADLLALIPGDRIQFTGLPAAVLGFDSWEGWFLGATERHTVERHEFELRLAPALPASAVFDTDRFMAAGELALSGNITNVATSIVVASTGALLSTTDEPYLIQIDDEQLTVVSVAGATSPQTVTVTRAANGTTAAAHSGGALIVSVPDSLFAF